MQRPVLTDSALCNHCGVLATACNPGVTTVRAALIPCRTAQVALDFGAYAEVAPQPGYLLTLSIPGEDADNCHFDKLDILEGQGMGTSEAFTLKSGEPPSEEMMAFVRLMNVSGAAASFSAAASFCTTRSCPFGSYNEGI